MADNWDTWIGRSEIREDIVSPAILRRFNATLDLNTPKEIAPDGVHWCLCLPDADTKQLKEDGHPPLGEFIPPLPFPRRMWAASSVRFLAPLAPNMVVMRQSNIRSIEEKIGKSGDLIFVEIDHITSCDGQKLIEERQSIVYRDHPTKSTPLPDDDMSFDLSDWPWRREVTPNTALLFRYSALTFNSHRIHYDRAYAVEQELYPALIVHGPLTATLLLQLCASELGNNRLASFEFRAKAPLYEGQKLYLVGRPEGNNITLKALGGDGRTAMEATAAVRA